MKGKIKYIRCIKGFILDKDEKENYNAGNCIMAGEIFYIDPDGDGTDCVGVEEHNRFPGIEIAFSCKELTEYFEFYIFKEK